MIYNTWSDFLIFVREIFGERKNNIILHDPRFIGNERKYLLEAMDSNFVSSISFCAEIVKVKEHDILSCTMTKGRIIASLWILCNNHAQK